MTSRKKLRILFYFVILLFCQPLYAAEDFIKPTYITCSVKQCPMLPPLLKLNEKLLDQVIVFESSPDKGFFNRYQRSFSHRNNGGWQHILLKENNFSNTYPIVGFGGAFTDSAAMLYHNLQPALKRSLIDSYFSKNGIAYSLGRVPIASSDFSCRRLIHQGNLDIPFPVLNACESRYSRYSYADQPNEQLDHFALQPEDINFKIPMIQAAIGVAQSSNEMLRLFASPWSAPAWMKSNGNMVHGSLLPKYKQIWANYFVKFLKSYLQFHIRFWAITIQNEPVEDDLGRLAQTWQTMYFTQDEEADFIKNYLGPSLKQLIPTYGSVVHLIMHDDQILTIQDRVKMLNDPNVAQYVEGVGLHWYTNIDVFYPFLDKTYREINRSAANKFILGTEACTGVTPGERGPSIGNWRRGEAYAHDIISDLNHHVSGWTDWNLLLDKQGGPNWARNYVDAPIIVDLNKQEFYRQPMFYYLGHFSKFLRPESKMISSQSQGPFPLEEVSFYVPPKNGLPGTIVIIVLNRDITERKYYILDKSIPDKNKYLNMHIPGHSIQTIIYRARIALC